MPKLIDYPRTSYTGAWEVAETVDDTGGKCALETCARKLNRKVSGSFKAIVGSAVKFGLLTSKRELLTTTTLFRRIKHAYDKQEELLFHREAFLTPPLFAQLCRKFRSRELPVAMLDVLLIREFDVEEINAQGVAKAFVEGARMVGVLNEHNMLADIDQLAAQQPARRELASPPPSTNTFRQPSVAAAPSKSAKGSFLPENQLPGEIEDASLAEPPATAPDQPPGAVTGGRTSAGLPLPAVRFAPAGTGDAIASLFGLGESNASTKSKQTEQAIPSLAAEKSGSPAAAEEAEATASSPTSSLPGPEPATPILFKLDIAGPGINTSLEVVDAEDLLLVRALLDKVERQLRRNS